MNRHPPNSIRSALHVIAGDSAAGSLRQAGGRDLFILQDAMFPGPCSTDPGAHLRLRRAFLRQLGRGCRGPDAEAERDYSDAVARGLPGAAGLAARLAAEADKLVVLW